MNLFLFFWSSFEQENHVVEFLILFGLPVYDRGKRLDIENFEVFHLK